MKSTLITAALAASATAAPATASLSLNNLNIPALLASLGPAKEGDPRFTNWQAPGSGDVRSPCPGLNTLANHGFLPHSGKGMNIVNLLQGMAAGMNMGPDFSAAIGGAGLLSSDTPLVSFDLNDLDQHNFPIEHDASLSRRDAYFGDDHSFYNPFWQNVLSFYHGYGGKTAIKPAALAINNRTQDSNNTNPTFTYGPREFLFRYGESALALQSMGSNDFDGVTNLTYVRIMFEQERLPYNEGWRPRVEPITLLSLGNMVFELFAANPNAAAEGYQITTSSYKDLWEGLVGGSEVLNNLTHGISSAVGL